MIIMSNLKKNKLEHLNEPRPGARKFLIEQTTALLIITGFLFKFVEISLPENAPISSIPELFLSVSNSPEISSIILGALLSITTWQIMYFDSAVPGVNPPSPLSPKKYREASGADFHLNYIFSLVVGPMAATFFYAGWV